MNHDPILCSPYDAPDRHWLYDLWDDEPLMVLNYAYRPSPARKHERISASASADPRKRPCGSTASTRLDTINAACGIELCVDLSATPFTSGVAATPRARHETHDRLRAATASDHRHGRRLARLLTTSSRFSVRLSARL